MSSMDTRIRFSAEDRGLSSTMRRLMSDADAFALKFRDLSGAVTAGLSTAGLGLTLRDALKWADEFDQSVFAIATTLSDTVKAADMSAVFDQNARHAEAMFRVLQKEAGRSIATVGELRKAYQVFAASGLALDPTEKSAATLSSLVSRIRLATIGQDPNMQIAQEMRALLEGRSRADSALSRIFAMRDPNYQATVKGLVARGDGTAVMDYLSSLISDIDLSGKVGNLLSVQLSQVQDTIRTWAIEAFGKLKEGIVEALGGVSAALSDPDSPLRRGLASASDFIVEAFERIQRAAKGFASSGAGRILANLAPQVLAVSASFSAFAVALGGLKMVLASLLTLPGLAVAGYAAYQGTREYLSEGRGNGDLLAMRDGRLDTENTIRTACAKVIDLVDYVKDNLTGAWRAVIDEGILPVVGDILVGSFQELIGAGMELTTLGSELLLDFTKGVLEWLDGVYDMLARRAPSWINDGLASLAADLVGGWNAFYTGFLGILVAVGRDLTDTLDWLRGKFDEAMSHVKDTLDELVYNVGSKLSGLPVLGGFFGGAAESANRRAIARHTRGEDALTDNAGAASRFVTLLDQVKNDYEKTFRGFEDSRRARAAQEYVNWTKPGERGELSRIGEALGDLSRRIQESPYAHVGAEWVRSGYEQATEGWDAWWRILNSDTVLNERTAPIERKEKTQDVLAVTGERKGLDPEASMKATGGYLKELERLYRSLGDYRADSVACESQILDLTNRRLALDREISELSTGDAEKDREILGLQNSLGDAIDRQVASLQRKKAVYDTIGELERKGDGLGAGFLSGMQKYAGEGVTAMQGAEKVIQGIASGLETTFSDLFLDVLTGDLDSFGDYFARWGQMILQTFAQVVSEMLVKWAVVKMITAASGFFGFGGSSGGGAITGAPTGGQIGPTGGFAGPTGRANGGLFHGGFTPFADGGVVSRPTLGLVGEGRYNEAVVPLPDGRAIPVVMQGGAANVIVNVTDNTGMDVRKTVNSRQDDEGQTIIDIILDAARRNRDGFASRMRGALAMGGA